MTERTKAAPAVEQEAPELLVELVLQAERAGASDIHLQMCNKEARVSFRLGGVLTPGLTIPEGVAERVFGRIKYLSRLKTYQDALPQDGRIDRADLGSRQDVRVATYPTVTGEKVVLRLFLGEAALSLEELGFTPEFVVALQALLRSPSGLLLLTGPAGCGKTTTIYGCLRYLAALGGRHIITIEDPVEQVIPGVMQTEVNDALGLDFVKATRHLLRQDPQILVVGEIRDPETASLVVRAALTGHLVISTLHAGSCSGVLERLLVMCPDAHAVVSALSMMVNQRLLRRICSACGGSGCSICLQSGFKGRIPIVEHFLVDASNRQALRTTGVEGVRPPLNLLTAAQSLVARGVTTQGELERVLGS